MAGYSAGSLLLLSSSDVRQALADGEADVLDSVKRAYIAYDDGRAVVPPSVFLRGPRSSGSRFIALPAYLEDGGEVAGMKWIASFPENLHSGLPRASAVIIMNSCSNGQPEVILEGALISAQRTAASAALVAAELVAGRRRLVVALIGCGRINAEILRFLRFLLPAELDVQAYDVDADRALALARQLGNAATEFTMATSVTRAIAEASIISFATTATTPHIRSLAAAPRDAVVLHVSLRDLAPEVIVASDNIVDDLNHVSREGTSIELARTSAPRDDFVVGTIGDVLRGQLRSRLERDKPVVVSPFGLGMLDLAVASVAVRRAGAAGLGTVVERFTADEKGE